MKASIKLFNTLVIGLSLSFGLSVLSFAQNSSERFDTVELAENLFLINGAGANILLLEGDNSLSIVDGGNKEHAPSLLSFLKQGFKDKPVTTAFNTHWHLDQIGSNELLASNDAEIIAHQNTKLWMGMEVISKWENKVYPPQSNEALPTKIFFYGSESVELDGVVVQYGLLPQAHTDGDIYVYFPQQNIVAGGDVITDGRYPTFDYSTGGWVGGMITSLQLLLESTNENTIYVPAYGGVRTREDIEAQLVLCQTLIQAITQSYYAGETYQEFLASDPLAQFNDTWSGDASMFLHTAYEGAWGHVTELRRYR